MPGGLWEKTPDGRVIRRRNPAPEPRRSTPDSTGKEEKPPVPAGKASLKLALRLGFRDVYDAIGIVLVASLLWSFLAGLGMLGVHSIGRNLGALLSPLAAQLLSTVGALFGLILTSGPLFGGINWYARKMALRREPEVFDLAWGFGSAFRRCLGLALIQAIGSVVLASNLWFYLSTGHVALAVIGSLFGYGLLLWMMMCAYQWPLLVEQDLAPWASVRKSALLILDNPGFSLGFGLVLLLTSALCWFTIVGGVVLWAGTVSILATQAVRELLRKYGLLPPDPTVDPIYDEMEH